MSEQRKSPEKSQRPGKGIVTVTVNPSIDMSTTVSQVVADRKLRCDAPLYEPGGGGINVTRAIKRMGGSSRALYAAGGSTGTRLDGLLKFEHIEHQAVEIERQTRVNLTVRETSSDRQFRFGMPGPFLQEHEWKNLLKCIKALLPSNEFVVASGSLAPGVSQDFYAKIARMCRKNDTRFVLDTSGEPLVRAVEEGVYLLKPNMREFQELVQREITDEKAQEKQVDALVRSGACEVLVLSLGSAGVLLATENIMKRLRAPSVPIRSRVGAGDSTVGGLVLGLHRGMPLEQSVLLGIAAGAAAVMTPGTELCRREDVFRLFEELKKNAASR